MPARDTVAGDATLRSSTSKSRLIDEVSGIRSPLIKVRILLSSITLFIDSIHMASIGPSNSTHFSSRLFDSAHALNMVERIPSAHSKVVRSYAPYSSVSVTDFGFMTYEVTGTYSSRLLRASEVLAFANIFQAVLLPESVDPTSILQCLVNFESYSCPIFSIRNGCVCRPALCSSHSSAAFRSPISETGSSSDGKRSLKSKRNRCSSSLMNLGRFISRNARIRITSSFVEGSARFIEPAILRTAFRFLSP
mmetsp:Transcript_14536/g.44979  ORF Transcript_14536/g.44979 Transcript_14536/m.44979 type:complete len:250 (-) Transcript_14536:10-759(-)